LARGPEGLSRIQEAPRHHVMPMCFRFGLPAAI
jgi:hypothetical protein